MFRFWQRLLRLSFYMAIYFLASVGILIFARNPDRRKRILSQNAQFFCGVACRVLDINIRIKNPSQMQEPALFVGNHMGFVDVLVMCSLKPFLFVTSQEMRKTFLLGWITEVAGCLYVDRQKKKQITREIQDISSALRSGYSVVLYPEATSHNGEELLPFKRSLLASAVETQVPIQLFCFNFLEVDSRPFDTINREAVCWYGDQTFVDSGRRLLKTKSIQVEVEFLDRVLPKPEEDLKEFTKNLRTKIESHFRPAKKQTPKIHSQI